MKYLVTRILLTLTASIPFFASAVSAQGRLTPEFRLNILFVDTLQTGSVQDKYTPRAIGYDPAATNGYDSTFGEDNDSPGIFLDDRGVIIFSKCRIER